jgi:tetratricopeptide (TPR) repeat protein
MLAARLVLLLATGAASGASEPAWHLARGANTTVISDAGEKQARLVARQLEQIRAVFADLVGLSIDVGKPLIAVAARDEDSLRRLLPGYWERRGGKRPAGVFLPGYEKHWAIVRVDVPEPIRVVQHEYVHLLVQSSLGGAPLWLNEGLAEFYGSAQVEGQEVRVGQIQPWHLSALRERSLLSIEDLFAVDHGSPEYEEESRASVFYAEAAALTHYFLLGERGRHRARLREFQRLVREDVPDDEAIRRALGDPRRIESELRAYVRGFSFYAVKAPAPVADQQIEVRPLREAQTHTLLADLAHHAGRTREARARVEEALRLEAGLALAHALMGVILGSEGHSEEGARSLAEAVRLAPGDALVQFRFGAHARGAVAGTDLREAALRRAIDLGPGYAPAYGELARLLLDEGRSLDEGSALAGKAIALEPAGVSYHATLLRLLSKQGRMEEARRAEERLMRVMRTDSGALPALVGYHESRGARDEAEAILAKARRQSPRNARVAMVYASFLERNGRADEAETVLRESLASAPRNRFLLNSLAYLNACRGLKLEEALEMADAALKQAPDSPAYQDTKGWVLFRLGRPAEAESWLRRSLSQSEDPEVREHLGDVLERAGRLAEAVDCWRQALGHPRLDEKRRPELESKIGRAAVPR